MIYTINKKFELEKGFLQITNKEQLLNLRNNLIKYTTENYTLVSVETKKEFGKKCPKDFYISDGDLLIKYCGGVADYYDYNPSGSGYVYDNTYQMIKCNNVNTIQIINMLTNNLPHYMVEPIFSEFVKAGIFSTNGFNINFNDHRRKTPNISERIFNLLLPGNEKDAESFQKALTYLEYRIQSKVPLNDIQSVVDCSKSINEIVACSKVLRRF